MSSLNGDVTVLRNGRSASQVSIYNYPEHLNPFYEEDQHKRLRFWHINKKNRGAEQEGRRNSFSMSGLKDMWAFKSLRFNKKKSSTLGINKTSESPPALRRQDYDYATSGNYTYDPQQRSSTNTPLAYGGEFERNANYRSSLQNVPAAANGLDFNRNNQYRSTIQFAPGGSGKRGGSQSVTMTPQARRFAGGPMTPQPQRYADSEGRLTRGSSQCSVSTNPFETDDEEDNASVLDSSGATGTRARRTPRKKRRAPPVPVHQPASAGAVDSSQQQHNGDDAEEEATELRIVENVAEISNLTAEIESFVRASSNETVATDRRTAPPGASEAMSSQEREDATQKKANGSVPRDSDRAQPAVVLATQRQTVIVTPPTPPTELRRGETTTTTVQVLQIEEASPRGKSAPAQTPPTPPARTVSITPPAASPDSGKVECIHVHVEEPRHETPPRDAEPGSRVTSFRPESVAATQTITTKTSFILASPPAERHTRTVSELHISESPERSHDAAGPPTSRGPKPPLAVKPELSVMADVHKKPSRRPKPLPGDGGTLSAAQQPLNNSSDVAEQRQQADGAEATKPNSDLTATTTAGDGAPQPLERLTTKRTSTATVKEVSYHVQAPPPPADPLRIVESEENLTNVGLEQQLLYRPKPPRSHFEWKHSTLAPLQSNLPPEKRKSVKDIIQSINRSQRLLQASAHKDLPPPLGYDIDAPLNGGSSSMTPLMTRRKLSEPNNNFDESQPLSASRKIYSNPTMSEDCNGGGARALAADGEDEEHRHRKLDNAEIFQKCRVNKEVYDFDGRETSPTASNLDWNPLPKPKRTKNLTEI